MRHNDRPCMLQLRCYADKKKRVSHSLEWETSGTYQRDESSSHGRDRQWTRVRKRGPTLRLGVVRERGQSLEEKAKRS